MDLTKMTLAEFMCDGNSLLAQSALSPFAMGAELFGNLRGSKIRDLNTEYRLYYLTTAPGDVGIFVEDVIVGIYFGEMLAVDETHQSRGLSVPSGARTNFVPRKPHSESPPAADATPPKYPLSSRREAGQGSAVFWRDNQVVYWTTGCLSERSGKVVLIFCQWVRQLVRSTAHGCSSPSSRADNFLPDGGRS